MAVASSRSSSCAGVGGLRSQARKALVVRAAADNQLLKKPDLKRPDPPPQPKKLFDDAAASPAPAAASTAPASDPVFAPGSSKNVTVEYQRQRAKEIRQYFLSLKAEEVAVSSRVFGWLPNNEISNGRWVMFGLLVGILTEYATGVDFIDQLKLMVSYLGIVDLD